ncbi:suppressor of fused domain protein [Asanoa sp. WMMD1127]|uniref:suppressor of fused domain protein n=1 Tax=Asanoa sp. WMMD1127 TaxID=3016107 RepID=UPI0024166F9E|nr:suppressor of fused domain protein [Asanoa sp. WMMD1127]MDG4820257.1 suppressor of fused domain protein [Asanoa sp. WMMD1127]
MSGLIEHLESYLGTMAGGSQGDETTPAGVRVGFFGPDSPFAGVMTVVTVGLWQRHLTVGGDGALHQELLMHVPNEDYPARAAGLLFQVAGELVGREAGLRQGQVLGPAGPVFPGSRMTALVATNPGYLPESFAVCRAEAVPIVLTLLVPVTTREADLVRSRGLPALTHLFAAQDPDLTNPNRPEVGLVPPAD